jgi:mannose-6-phosphate isomerase
MYKREAYDGICAESWEISAHPDGMSIVENGHLAGLSLADVVKKLGGRLLGRNVEGDKFPLLIKLIDAAKPLSVQVHPNNENADRVQGEPKTEMWYFLKGADDAKVHCGLVEGITTSGFCKALRERSFTSILRSVPATEGDAVFVPGGRVHAIDAGCLILEIQQNSNTTYRVYDWERVDANGFHRELHIDKALQVIDFNDDEDPKTTPVPFEENGVLGTEICRSSYFKLDRFEPDGEFKIMVDGSTFHALFIADGMVKIVWSEGEVFASVGSSLLIPAELNEYQIIPETKSVTVLRTTIPG